MFDLKTSLVFSILNYFVQMWQIRAILKLGSDTLDGMF